jgi:hypothetical protein
LSHNLEYGNALVQGSVRRRTVARTRRSNGPRQGRTVTVSPPWT